MAIYRYTLSKYMKAKSTWIILALGMLVVAGLGGILPWTFYNGESDITGQKYIMTSIGIVVGIAGVAFTFTTIFAGFKGATMFKDEVEDGSFLVILSKPVSRIKIILFKWFALQTINIMYSFSLITAFIAMTAIFHQSPVGGAATGTKLMTEQFGAIWGWLVLILFVATIIFSSIGIIISTKTSIAAAIGITTALGIMVNITGLFYTFTAKEEYSISSTSNVEFLQYSYLDKSSPVGATVDENSPIHKMYDMASDEDNGIIHYGLKTGETDGYKYAWVFDLSYQNSLISEFAREAVVDDDTARIIEIGLQQGGGNVGSSPFNTRTKNVAVSNTELSKALKSGVTGAETYIDDLMVDLISVSHDAGNEMVGIVNNFYIGIKAIYEASKGPNDPLLPDTIDDRNFANYIEQLENVNIVFGGNEVNVGDTLALIKGWYDDASLLTPIEDEDDTSILMSDETLKFFVNNATYEDLVISENLVGSDSTEAIETIAKSNDYITVTHSDGRTVLIDSESYDFDTYIALRKIAHEGDKYLSIVESKPYADKLGVLLTYIIVGLALVPLSIWIVKRQDYR